MRGTYFVWSLTWDKIMHLCLMIWGEKLWDATLEGGKKGPDANNVIHVSYRGWGKLAYYIVLKEIAITSLYGIKLLLMDSIFFQTMLFYKKGVIFNYWIWGCNK